MKNGHLHFQPTLRLAILTALLAAMYGFIFYMSSQDAVASGESSGRVTVLVERLLGGVQGMGLLEHLVRKAAHMAEFGLLCLLWYAALKEAFPLLGERRWLTLPLMPALLSAGLDELHQMFVPGRSAQLSDVVIDMGGACLAVLLIALVQYVRSRRRPSLAA